MESRHTPKFKHLAKKDGKWFVNSQAAALEYINYLHDNLQTREAQIKILERDLATCKICHTV